jgi:hypothetical protein
MHVPAGDELGQWRFAIGDTGRWLVLAFCENYESALWFEVLDASSGRMMYRGNRFESTWNARGSFAAVAGSTAQVVVHGRSGGWPVELVALHAKPRPLAWDELFQRRVQRWLETRFENSKPLPSAALVLERDGSLDAIAGERHRQQFDASLDAKGEYLIVAACDQPDDMSLRVQRIAAGEDELIDERRIGRFVQGEMVLDDAASIRVEAAASEPRAYRLRVYRASQVGPQVAAP